VPNIDKIRDDIYPDAIGPERNQIIDFWLNLVYQSFQDIFSSKEEMIDYINNLESPDYAELFLETGKLYYRAKYYHCPNCWRKIETCPQCNRDIEVRSFTVLTMIISIMEKLSRGVIDYLPFDQWSSKKEITQKYQEEMDSDNISNVKDLIEAMKREYYSLFGSITNVTDFFTKFLTPQEKIEFIKSIRFTKRVPDLPPRMPDIDKITTKGEVDDFFKHEKEEQIELKKVTDIRKYIENKKIQDTFRALPLCFDEDAPLRCYDIGFLRGGVGYCHYNYIDCKLLTDEDVLNDCFKEIIKTIYKWRSEYVHGERLPPIRELMALGDIYNGKLIYVELTTSNLKPIFERMVKRYFDSKISD